jgi:hypothetical protein
LINSSYRINFYFFTVKFNYALSSFANIWTKNAEREIDYNLRNVDQYVIPPIRLELFRKIPLVSLPTAWNEHGEGLRFQHNRITFKIALFDHLLNEIPI